MRFVQTNSGVVHIANSSLQLESLETKFPTKIETSISTVNKHQKTTERIGHLKTPRYSSGCQQLHIASCCQVFHFIVYSVHILKRWKTSTVPRLWIC